MVPLLHGQWAEVRTLVIGEVQPAVEERGEWVVHTRHLSYFSRRISAEEFVRLALVEIQRRGVENARQVAAVMDGSDWLQGLTDYHRPDAVRILDFPHAGEHLSRVGEFLYGEGTPQAQEWLQERLHRLKHEGPKRIFTELRRLQAQHPEAAEISGNLAYLQKRKSQIQYPHFQAQGWPIGSGIVESGNKLVVEARLKGSPAQHRLLPPLERRLAQDRAALTPTSLSTKTAAASVPKKASTSLRFGDPKNSIPSSSGDSASDTEETEKSQGQSLA